MYFLRIRLSWWWHRIEFFYFPFSSSEKIWFPRPPDPFEVPEATTTASDDTTLEDEEVEIKLPCRSVSINVVGMPSGGHEVTSSSSLLRPFEVTNLLMMPKSYETTNPAGMLASSFLSSPPKTNFVSNNTLQASRTTTTNINNKKRPTKLSLHNGIQCDEKLWKQDKLRKWNKHLMLLYLLLDAKFRIFSPALQ